MATNKVRDILRQAHSSRIKYAFTALVEIRKKLMKTPKDVAVLVNNGLVKRLLDLLRSRESLEEHYRSKVIDICLSILSNMCMEDVTRKKVLKDKGTGVNIIVELFEEVEAECLQNRACRCLSNLLLDPGSWELVCTSSVIEKVVKLLKDTDKEEYKQTCIRAIRLLGQTGPHVQKLVEQNAVSVVAKLLDSDTEALKQSSLRCVHSLSSHGPTLQFASQVIASGKLPYLLTLVKESNIEAFQVVIRMCEYHNFRAAFGNGGGIGMFKEMYSSSESFCERFKEDFLSVLCLCCKEAVNRVKLRDENILVLLIQALSEDMMNNLHARIISAFVCFLYDETSFEVLLDHGMVPLLVRKLKNCFMKEIEGASVDDREELNDKNEEGQMENIPVVREKTEVVEKKEIHSGSKEDKDRQAEEEIGQVQQHSGTVKGDSDDKPEDQDQCMKRAKTRPIYSIDSPTYQPNIEWEYEDYGGAKCIERFTPPHNVDFSIKETYSPLSNSSYYSPVESSPDYSPPSSPNTSLTLERTSRNIFPATSPNGYSPLTGSQSPENFHPKYPKYTAVSGGLYTTSVSPEPGSSRSRSPDSSIFSSPDRPLGSEDDLNISPETLSPESFNKSSEEPFVVQGEQESVTFAYQTVDNDETGDDVFSASSVQNKTNSHQKGEESLSLLCTESNKSMNANILMVKEMLAFDERFRRKRKKVSSRNNVTEYNILILLSRVSQMTDPTMHLVAKDVLHCLLDYMNVMETPLARCPRLLSRVFRNPVCFSKVLTYCIPALIYEKLLKYEDLKSLSNDLRNNRKTIRRKATYGNAEIQHEVETDSDRFSMTDDLIPEEEQALKRRRTAEHANENSHKRSHSFKGQYHKQEEDICDSGKSAVALLEDLNGVLDSSYGRGVVDRLLYTVPGNQATDLCINVLYITWTEASRQYFFNQREVLDQVISTFQPEGNFDKKQFVSAVSGMRFLVNIIDTKSKYQMLKMKKLWIEKSNKSATSGKDLKVRSPIKSISVEDIENNTRASLGSSEKIVQHKIKTDKQSGSVSPLPIATSCCLASETVTMDTVFAVKGEKVLANRAMLVDKSEIFSAMLEGHYSESKMSEISIPETSKFAFEFLIHFLHGCEIGNCTFIDQLYEQTVNKDTANQCIELLGESNKYMVPDLYSIANEYLFSRYLIPDSAFSVLKYAVLHRKDSLIRAAVSCIFYDSKTAEEVTEHLFEVMCSCYADIFLSTLREILTE